MKGAMALGIAVALGFVAAIFNFAYLGLRAQDMEMVSFVGIKPEVTIAAGEKLKEEDLEEVKVPKLLSEGIRNYAVMWTARGNATNTPVSRTLKGPQLLLEDDCRPPAPSLSLAPDEEALGVPIDSHLNVPSLIQAGQMVKFCIPQGGAGMPTPARRAPPRPERSPDAAAADGIETFGPFRVVSVGNRLGSVEVQRTSKLPQMQENVVMIAVKVEDGRLEPRAEALYRAVHANEGRGVQVLISPASNDK